MDTIDNTKPELKYMDLVYFGYDDLGKEGQENKKLQQEFIEKIKETFPNVELKNAYDQIKGFRQEVYLEEKDEDNYYSWLFGKLFYDLSLTLQLIMMSAGREPEQKVKFDRYFALAKKQYPEAFKPEAL